MALAQARAPVAHGIARSPRASGRTPPTWRLVFPPLNLERMRCPQDCVCLFGHVVFRAYSFVHGFVSVLYRSSTGQRFDI